MSTSAPIDINDESVLCHIQNSLVAGLLDAAPVSSTYTNAALAMAVRQIFQTYRRTLSVLPPLVEFWEQHKQEYMRLLEEWQHLDDLPAALPSHDRWS